MYTHTCTYIPIQSCFTIIRLVISRHLKGKRKFPVMRTVKIFFSLNNFHICYTAVLAIVNTHYFPGTEISMKSVL